jgi:hypothetical protein
MLTMLLEKIKWKVYLESLANVYVLLVAEHMDDLAYYFGLLLHFLDLHDYPSHC